jgi:hypothetical protein
MASSALPDLQLGSDQLIDFLKAELATLENDLGGPDAEARGLLDMLQRQTRLIQQMSGEDAAEGAAALTDLEIAQQINRQASATMSAVLKHTQLQYYTGSLQDSRNGIWDAIAASLGHHVS